MQIRITDIQAAAMLKTKGYEISQVYAIDKWYKSSLASS